MDKSTSASSIFRPHRRQLALLLLCGLAVYVLVPQLGDFQASWQLLRHPQPGWVVVALGFTVLTYAVGAATYCLLAFKRLRYGQTLLVQVAGTFISRLLPAGVGALGINYLYLRHVGHSIAQAASVVAINNPLGFIGHGLVLTVTLLLFSGHAGVVTETPDNSIAVLLKAMAAGGLIIIILAVIFGRHRVKKVAADVGRQLLSYRRRPWSLAGALLTSITLTLCNALCLLACQLALGVDLPFGATLLILTLGVGAGAATPTPGGLGGFEAGLVAGLIAYNTDSSLALAVVLLYRLISYWLPLLAGALAFTLCQRRGLFEANPGS